MCQMIWHMFHLAHRHSALHLFCMVYITFSMVYNVPDGFVIYMEMNPSGTFTIAGFLDHMSALIVVSILSDF